MPSTATAGRRSMQDRGVRVTPRSRGAGATPPRPEPWPAYASPPRGPARAVGGRPHRIDVQRTVADADRGARARGGPAAVAACADNGRRPEQLGLAVRRPGRTRLGAGRLLPARGSRRPPRSPRRDRARRAHRVCAVPVRARSRPNGRAFRAALVPLLRRVDTSGPRPFAAACCRLGRRAVGSGVAMGPPVCCLQSVMLLPNVSSRSLLPR